MLKRALAALAVVSGLCGLAQAATLDDVKRLRAHADFDVRNPNKVRALLGAFVHSNPGAFHRADAAGYVFWAERVIELDAPHHRFNLIACGFVQ